MTQSENAASATTDLSKRTPQEIFAHHGQALGAEDLDAIMLDYADDAIFIFGGNVLRDKEAIRNNFFVNALQTLPKAQWGVKPTFADDILYLEWTCDSTGGSVSDGVDTFVFRDGLIRVQTVRCTIIPKT